jgi:hypothetical protein
MITDFMCEKMEGIATNIEKYWMCGLILASLGYEKVVVALNGNDITKSLCVL